MVIGAIDETGQEKAGEASGQAYQARSRWFHKRARLTRDAEIAPVSYRG
jgi:hypothetical protein